MKSLKLKRLMSLENNTPVTIIYGNYRRFSGIVTENDNKKSLEIKNKKDEFLIVDYSDIVSLKIKKKLSSAAFEKKSVRSDESEIPEKQICPDEPQIPENQNYHFALANLYYSEKHYKKALEELEGDFFEARFLKAIILYETGYLALARKELSELALEYPSREMVNEYMTRINSELGLN